MFRLLALLTVLGSALAVIDWGDSSQATLSRLLAIGDFDGFNEALQGVSLQLGDLPQIEQFILISQLVINLRDVECRDIQIGDIVASFNVTNATDADGDAVDELTFDLAATPFSMNCYANYSYSFSGLRSSGIMTANSRNNNFAVTLGFQSPSFEEHPPNTTVVNDCQTEVDIYNLEFSTGLEAIIVALFERAVANLVESQAAGGKIEYLCVAYVSKNVFQLSVAMPRNCSESWIQFSPMQTKSLRNLCCLQRRWILLNTNHH